MLGAPAPPLQVGAQNAGSAWFALATGATCVQQHVTPLECLAQHAQFASGAWLGKLRANCVSGSSHWASSTDAICVTTIIKRETKQTI